MNPQPDCDLVRRWISLSEDQELTTDRSEMLEAHLDRCSACQKWHAEFQTGLDAFGIGCDEVVEEIDHLLTGHLDPDQLLSESEPAEVAMAAENAAPRMAAMTALMLLVISLVAWWWISSAEIDELDSLLTLRSVEGESRVELAGEVIDLRPGVADQWVRLRQQVTCIAGEVVLIDPAGRRVKFGSGARLQPLTNDSIALQSGTARFEVEPKGKGYSVITEEVTIRVTGTVFEMRRLSNPIHTEVLVIEGSVEVVRGETLPLPLHQGERVEVSGEGGLMFHSARQGDLGEARPRARLGPSRAVPQNTPEPLFEEEEPQDGEGVRSRQSPLDLPVNSGDEADRDGR
ncbi:MAG: FecR domain-containing protein [Planctomycetota bacterium]|nr:FecR domain-containing protein [Planctomycetota bacterium]